MRKVWLLALAVIFCLALAGCSKLNALERTTLRSFDCDEWHGINTYSLTSQGSPFLKPHPEYTLFPEVIDYKNPRAQQSIMYFGTVIGYIDEPTGDNDTFEFRQMIIDIDGKKATYDHVNAFGKKTDNKEYIYTHVQNQKDMGDTAPEDSEGQTPVGYDAENTADDLDRQIISLLVDIYNSDETVITFVTADSTAQTCTTIDKTVSGVDRDAIRLALTLYACKANEPGLLKEIGVNP